MSFLIFIRMRCRCDRHHDSGVSASLYPPCTRRVPSTFVRQYGIDHVAGCSNRLVQQDSECRASRFGTVFWIAGTQAATPGCNDVVEIRYGMPRDVRGFRSILDPVKAFRGRTGVGTLVERDVDKHVGAWGMGEVADLAIPVLDPDAAPRRPYSKHSVHSPGPMLRPQTLVPVAVRSVCLAVGSADRPFIMSLSAPVAPSVPRWTPDGSILAARRRQMSVGLRQRVPDQPTAYRLMRCKPPGSAPDPATNH